MPPERQLRAYSWMAAGALALGIGAALAGGEGVAHADTTAHSPGSPGPAHHRAAAAPPRATAQPSRSSQKPHRASGAPTRVRGKTSNTTAAADQAGTADAQSESPVASRQSRNPAATSRSIAAFRRSSPKPRIASNAITRQEDRAIRLAAAADDTPDFAAKLAAQEQAIKAQNQAIVNRGASIAADEKEFVAEVWKSVKVVQNSPDVTPRFVTAEIFYGTTSGALYEFAQASNVVARGLNVAAQGVFTLESVLVSQFSETGPLAAGVVYAIAAPITGILGTGASWAGGASTKFYVTAGAYESKLIENVPQ